jgi:hypothetical protein
VENYFRGQLRFIVELYYLTICNLAINLFFRAPKNLSNYIVILRKTGENQKKIPRKRKVGIFLHDRYIIEVTPHAELNEKGYQQIMKDHIAQFWSYGRELQEEAKFLAVLKQLLKEVRKNLDDGNPLATSIDNNDSSETMAIIASQENYPELAEILLLDSFDGDKRKAERRDVLKRRQEARRITLSPEASDKRQTSRRSDLRRDPMNEKRGSG